jgi:hypothetical protein
MSRLQHHCDKAIDITGWYQAVSADISGCFMTGKPFGCVESEKPHPVNPDNHRALKELAFGTAFSKNFFLRNFVVGRKVRPLYAPSEMIAKERFDEALEKLEKGECDGPETLFGALMKGVDTEAGVPREVAFRSFADFVLGGFDTV